MTQQWKLPMLGGCRCGQLRFAVDAPPLITMACHCTGCQKMSASAFSLTMVVAEDAFRVTKGEPVIGGMHDERLRHQHCDHCKSWVFTRIVPGRGFVNVRPSMLDDFAWFEPWIESYTSEAQSWARTGARHSFPQFPAPEEYGPLMAEFAEIGPKLRP